MVRTPHGDADIDIVSAPGTTTLGDLITAVTGQAPPSVARVDGRAVSAAHVLASLELTVGTVIDATAAAADAPEAKPDGVRVNLLQLTGRGAGSVRTLSPGRFRIGPGRRVNAEEMVDAPVETAAFEVRVDSNGSVMVSPGQRIGGALGVMTPTLDHKLFDRELPWTTGRLSVGGRLFQLENPALEPPRRQLPDPDERGAIPFQRQQRMPGASELLAVSAQRRASSASQGLWARRRTDAGAYSLPFGILPDDETTAIIDFSRHRGAALVGSDRFGAGLARTLIAEAVTQYGPSDLELVIASTPERLGQWDWAKWLPHLRRGDPTTHSALLAERLDLETWAASMTGRTHVDAFATRREEAAADGAPPRWTAPSDAGKPAVTTLLVLDDISLWSQRDSPLRNVLVDPPPHLRIIALCGGMHEAPGMCSALIEERLPAEVVADAGDSVGSASLYGSLATLHLRIGQSPEEISEIRPAFVETAVALDIARLLAPLDDLDVARPPTMPTRFAPPSLEELIELQINSDDPGRGLTVAVGLVAQPEAAGIGSVVLERRPVRIDLAESRVTLLSASDRDAHDTVVAATILGATAVRRTDQLSVLTVGAHRPAWHGEIPHIAGHVDRSTPDDPARLVHRVAHVLTQQPGLEVLVVIEDAFTAAQPTGGDGRVVPNSLLTGMLELAESLSRVHLLVTTEYGIDALPDRIRDRCGIALDVTGGADDPHGTVTSDHAAVRFVGPTRVADPTSQRSVPTLGSNTLLIRPNVHGRAMTPLERRVSRSAPRVAQTDHYDPETQQIAQRIAAGSTATDGTGSMLPTGGLLPPPLPTSIEHSALLDAHQGDGVPLGLLDRPEQADNEAYWWAPGEHGSLLAIGSPRSGMTHLSDLFAVGIAARMSVDDISVFAVEPLPQRRRAFDALPHSAAVVSTDEPNAAARVIATVAEILDLRRSNADHGDPAVLLIIGDLARLIRWLPDDSRSEVLETLATIGSDGPLLGVNLVCIASRVDDLGPLVRLAGDRLVGTVSDASDRTRLGVPAPGPTDRHNGRCWSVDADRRVQLATPPDSVEHEVARLAPGIVTDRPGTPATDRGLR